MAFKVWFHNANTDAGYTDINLLITGHGDFKTVKIKFLSCYWVKLEFDQFLQPEKYSQVLDGMAQIVEGLLNIQLLSRLWRVQVPVFLRLGSPRRGK